jgi:hypothetical protein
VIARPDDVRPARLIPVVVAMVAVAGISTWLFAADERGSLPNGDYVAVLPATWLLAGPQADALRRDALNRAAVKAPGFHPDPGRPGLAEDPFAASPVVCRFVYEEPSGTSAKFSCVLDGGEVVKVKYGRNPEVQGEAAATRLLTLFGYLADDVRLVPRLRCYGCPRDPFLMSRVLSLARLPNLLHSSGYDSAYTDFTWVAMERRFNAPAIETPDREGWGWYELRSSLAPRAELDALRLLAIFLAHWDNKAGNQRLVCLDDSPPAPDGICRRTALLIHDLGATFGPPKVNLAAWRSLPVWADRRQCLVSMRRLPWQGATFPDALISEEGRVQLARQLTALSRDDVRELFRQARFPDYHSGTDDERDLDAWTSAFEHRVDQIVSAGPCPESPRSRP